MMRIPDGRRMACVMFMIGMCLLVGAEWGRTDGKFYPSHSIAEHPTTPYQRALLLHRDGEQTLVVESSMMGEPGEYGWLLPVPAVPSDFGTVAPLVFENLSVATTPHRWKTKSGSGVGFFFLLACFVVVVAMLYPGLRQGNGFSILGSLLFGLILLVAFGFLGGSLSRGTIQSMSAGITVHVRMQVDLHDVAVLEAQTPAALDAWLGANGFQGIPAEQTEVVESYIASDWVFVATRFTAPDMEVATPNPLRITFPTERPVYPMRLTRAAVTEEGVHLTLFVVAEEPFVHPELVTEFADRFSFHSDLEDKAGALPGVSLYQGKAYGHILGHPDLIPLLWDGCVVMHLAGAFRPEQMERDIWLEPGGRVPVRNEFFSMRDLMLLRLEDPLLFFLHIILWGGILLAVVMPSETKKDRLTRMHLFLILTVFATGMGVAFGVLFPTLMPNRAFQTRNIQYSQVYRRFGGGVLDRALEEKGYPATVEEAHAWFLDYDRVTAEGMDVPSWTWIEDERGVVLRRICSILYVPIDLVLSDPYAYARSRAAENHLERKAYRHSMEHADSIYSGGLMGLVLSMFFVPGFFLLFLWHGVGGSRFAERPNRMAWLVLLAFVFVVILLLLIMTREPIVLPPFLALGYFHGDGMVLVSMCVLGYGGLCGRVCRRAWERSGRKDAARPDAP